MGSQLSILELIEQGEQLKEKGLDRAIDHAESNLPGWKEKIYSLFKTWLKDKRVGYQFRTESFRLWVETNELIETRASKRSYGFICPKAAREGLIEFAGHEKVVNPRAHRCLANTWRRI